MSTIATIDDLGATKLFETYWRLASERQAIYEKRLRGEPPPWTNDPILSEYKFTNAFRASDRTSQFLTRNVIYESGGSMEDREVVFRILLFKLFNSIDAWEALREGLGHIPAYSRFGRDQYARVLGDAWSKGVKIWNPAYTQRPQTGATDAGYARKHERYLSLLKTVMREDPTGKLKSARTYRQAYFALWQPPLYGEFLTMQHLTDINYSPVLNFDENDFIVAGLGCLNGMQKCFGIRPDKQLASEIIRRCVEHQEGMFADLGLQPVTLFGRRLTAIDVQNLFCEVDKYSRLAHRKYSLKRTAIKQKFRFTGPLPPPYFPPKWGLDTNTMP